MTLIPSSGRVVTLGESDGLAEAAELVVVVGGEHEEAVRGAEVLVGGDLWVGVAEPSGDFLGGEIALGYVRHHGYADVE